MHTPGSYFFRGQLAHLGMVVVLVVGACLLVDLEQLSERQMLGISVQSWFVIALVVPIVHQVYVWLAWRSQLCFGTLTKLFGRQAFVIYQAVFMMLLLSRPVSLLMLAIADIDSLVLPVTIRVVICTVLGLPVAYAMYSVVRYFGMARAAGKDHFDESFRQMPLVTKGIYRYTSNAMYAIVFLGVWVIAIACASWAALLAAGFSHAYIWVHYYCTERPDMRVIYGR
jgi:hypothetical protein